MTIPRPKHLRRVPRHPGFVLKRKFLEPLGLSVYALAAALGVPRVRLNDIVRGRLGISADSALRLARYFRTTLEFWINLQVSHDLVLAEQRLGPKLKAITPRGRTDQPGGGRAGRSRHTARSARVVA